MNLNVVLQIYNYHLELSNNSLFPLCVATIPLERISTLNFNNVWLFFLFICTARMVSIFLAFWFFAKNEKFKAIFRKKRKPIFFNFFHFITNVTESFNFWLVKILKTLFFAIFQSGLYWRHCKIIKKSSKMGKFWIKKIDFSFFALNFLWKTKKWKNCENENFRFSLETIDLTGGSSGSMGSGFSAVCDVSICQLFTSSQSPHFGWKTTAQNFLAVVSVLSKMYLISSWKKNKTQQTLRSKSRSWYRNI